MLIVLGSINVDMVFSLDHLPAPGETVLTEGFDLLPGGKGANQAAAAAKAGCHVRIIGCIGDDSHGAMMRQTLRLAGVDLSGLVLGAKPTGLAIIGVDRSGENSIIVGSGANLEVWASQIADSDLTPERTLLCQNEILLDETVAALKRAKALGARSVLNMAPAGVLGDDVLAAVDIFILNEHEVRVVAKDETSDLSEIALGLARRHQLSCVITLGPMGALMAAEGMAAEGDVVRFGALNVKTVDTTGAGDTFAGVLAAMLDENRTLVEAVRWAIAAAGLCCETLGAQTGQPKREAIAAALATMQAGPPH